MEVKKLSQDQIDKLRKPLPPEAVKPHPTKTYLSSIKAIYVVERLNEVFGIGSWELSSEVISDKSAMIVVRTKLFIPEYNIRLESFGGNDNGGENSKNFDLGDAYKGATTDALTKICSYLEIGMSVFKGQGNVSAKKPEEQKPIVKQKVKFTSEHKNWNEAHRKISQGEGTVDKLRETFIISEEDAKILNGPYNG